MADEPVAHHPNLTTRGGTYYLRMRVPLELVQELGRTHITKSLRTKEHRVALARFRLAQAQAERDFEAARRQMQDADALRMILAKGRLERLMPEQVQEIAQRWFASAVQHVARSPKEQEHLRTQDWDIVLEDTKAEGSLLQSPDPLHYEEHVHRATDQILLAAGVPPVPLGPGKIQRRVRRPKVDRETVQYRQLASFVRRGLISLNRCQVTRLTGEPNIEHAEELGSLEFGRSPSAKRTLNELIDAFQADPGRGSRTGKTDVDYAMVFLALREVVGADTPVTRITRESAKGVRDLFRALPPNATKRFPGKTLSQAAEVATRTGLRPLNTQTVNSHLTKVATLFNWAVREEWINKNPASGLSIDEAPQSRREPFSVPQLQAMFAAPLFTGCQDDETGYAKVGTSRPRRARFWVPLLSLFHGLRLNEGCQLRPEDIVERDGLPAIFVRSADAGQRVKSQAGTRIVPLHPEIVVLGFLDFVAQARLKHQERLFPELSRDARGYYSDAFQKWFSRFLVSCGATGPGKSFHCFRHAWADRLREAGVPEDRRRALGGWANTGVDAGYGRGFPTRMLADDIAKVSYPGLALEFPQKTNTDGPKIYGTQRLP